MKKAITAFIAVVILALIGLGYHSAAQGPKHELNPKETIFEHLGDAYGWEVPFNHHAHIPLPVIVKGQDGWHCFMSSRIADGATCEGFCISRSESYHGKVVQMLPDGSEYRPLDFSITKNVLGIFIAAVVVILLVMAMKRWYARNGLKAPRGAKGLLELIVEFVYGDTIRPILGKHAPRYAPYLLTVFFFILTMNLLGLIVIFPGGANLTGNIAVTMVLAVLTFLITAFSGTREYWKETFWPDVPMALKCPVPMMQIIEVLGMFTKPLALMIRLFANMMSGHMVVLVLVLLIFIFTNLFGVAVGAGTAIFSVAFTLFMLLLDTLVSFIQAYVFTILSTIFISMALVEPHHEAE
ncbi:MAG: F0F1 ATP synthase subunit A [Muribaculaceae bacterium]|nr:F0F1 ATP synthase subunit A [Muribaculaceae bacterium]